eukprot:359290-Chlamydomonas_euryale.AAC.3
MRVQTCTPHGSCVHACVHVDEDVHADVHMRAVSKAPWLQPLRRSTQGSVVNPSWSTTYRARARVTASVRR